MKLYKGKIVIDVLTVVESNEDENVMKNYAHENITNELMNELMALVGANGYLVGGIGADLNYNGEAKNQHIRSIEKSIKDSKIKAGNIYNKFNIITTLFKL